MAVRIFGTTALLILIILGGGTASCMAQANNPNQVLATVNSKEIFQDDVDASIAGQLMPLQQQIYALRKSALDNLVIAALLEQEAQRRGISVEDLKKLWTAAPVEVSKNAVEELYRETASAFGALSSYEAKERLRLDLENQARMKNYRAAVLDLKGAARIDLSLDEPRLAGISDGSKSHFLGSARASVTIVEFSDFQCPYCREAQNPLKQVLDAYKDDVRVIFRHLPLDIHSQSFISAQSAFCAGEQNRFWPFHDALFSSDDLSASAINKIAANLRLDLDNFEICLASDSSRASVLQDLQEAKRLGIVSTPTFVINGRLVRGAINFEAFKQIIDQELPSASSGHNRRNVPTSNLQEKR